MSTIYFTLCSNNYLAQAKTLADSIMSIYPNDKVFIGLVDRFDSAIDYNQYKEFEILPYDQLGFDEFDDMISRYNIIEFNTAVKPFYFDYFFKKFGEETSIVYLDPDIVLYRELSHVFDALENHSVVLTPMFNSVPRQTSLDELIALRHGLYNLGFLALKYSLESLKLVEWWKERLRTHCLIAKNKGIFVDQKWMDLAPLLFDGVFILKHPGYNMAWWNFSERKLIQYDNDFYVNNRNFRLHFFHFSGFKPRSSSITSRSSEDIFLYELNLALLNLGIQYEKKLIENNYDFLKNKKTLLIFFETKPLKYMKLKTLVKKIIKRLTS